MNQKLLGDDPAVFNPVTLRPIPVPDAAADTYTYLMWDAAAQDAGENNATNIVGYNVYRSVDGKAFTKLTTQKITRQFFTDPIPADGDYVYALGLVFRGSPNVLSPVLSASSARIYKDSDADTLPDWWEILYFGNEYDASPDEDADRDGLSNAEECVFNTSPFLVDSDGDGVKDGVEVDAGTDPSDPSSRYVGSPYAESFEDLSGWGGVYTSVWRKTGWLSSSVALDRSQLVNMPCDFGTVPPPLPSATHTNALRLDTQGAVLTNRFDDVLYLGGDVTRIEMMMRFVPNNCSNDIFTAGDTGIKGAVSADMDNRLVVYHGVAAEDGTLVSNTVDTSDMRVDPDRWHRVTLTIDATSMKVALFQVKIDGVPVTHASAYAEGWRPLFLESGLLPPTDPAGTWFRAATSDLQSRTLSGLSFWGAGYVDDLVAAAVPKTFLLSIVKSGNGRSSLGLSRFSAIEVPVGTETQIVYLAEDWNRIAGLASNGIPVSAASGRRVYTQEVARIEADISNEVDFAVALPAQTGFADVPTEWLMHWTEDAVMSGDGDSFDVRAEYLLGLSPASANTLDLYVESLRVVGGDVVTVVRRNVTGESSPDGMHGTLRLRATDSLDSPFEDIANTSIGGTAVFDAENRRAYTNSVDRTSRFFRAVIE